MAVTKTDIDYTVMHVDEMERVRGDTFVRVRASLGVTSFGMQVIDLPPKTGDMAPEHDHLHNGQEEVYLLLGGEAELVLPDRVVLLDRETFVRIGPATRRRLRSGPVGARVLALGGQPGQAYEPQPNSELGGTEAFGCPTASSDLIPDGPPPKIELRGRF